MKILRIVLNKDTINFITKNHYKHDKNLKLKLTSIFTCDHKGRISAEDKDLSVFRLYRRLCWRKSIMKTLVRKHPKSRTG